VIPTTELFLAVLRLFADSRGTLCVSCVVRWLLEEAKRKGFLGRLFSDDEHFVSPSHPLLSIVRLGRLCQTVPSLRSPSLHPFSF